MKDTTAQNPAPYLPEQLEKLLEERDGPCISIYMPTHSAWSETPQNIIRYKNLLRKTQKQLTNRGLRSEDIQSLLEPAHALEENEAFWRAQRKGLALFLSRDLFITFDHPHTFEETIVANDRFYITNLLKGLASDGRYFVLTISKNAIRLFACTAHSLSEMPLENTPTSLDEALQYDEFETQHQFHSGSSGSFGHGEQIAMFHGHGAAADDANVNKRIEVFFQQVDNGVREMLAGEQAPLVLVGLDHLQGFYRNVNHYAYLEEKGVAINPQDLKPEALHRRSWSIVEPRFRKEREEALAAYRHLSHTEPNRVSNQLERIVPAAYFKRLKVLFVRIGAHAWGTFSPENQQVQLHDKSLPQNQDLLDFAVVHTLRHQGDVYVEDAEAMPDQSPIAAIFRF